MSDKRPKYFCKKCRATKLSKIIHLFNREVNPPERIGQQEVIKTFSQTVRGEVKTFKGRQLECNHFISFYEIPFIDESTENLDQFETELIRKEVDRAMIGSDKDTIGSHILFQVEQYQTLLRIASKQKQQAKYAIQYIEQLKEKFSGQLQTEDEKKNFDQKFRAFTKEDYASGLKIERIQKQVVAEVNKKDLAFEKSAAILAKGMGISLEAALAMMGGQKKPEVKKELDNKSNVEKMKDLLNTNNK